MPRKKVVELVSLNTSRKLAMFDDGSSRPFSVMLDIDGDETENVVDAIVVVVQTPNGRWMTIDMSQLEPATLQ